MNHAPGGAPHAESSYSEVAGRAPRPVDREVQRAVVADHSGPWVIWAPQRRAWHAYPATYVEAVENAQLFTLPGALEIWIASGYNDVPMTRAAAVLLMGALERRAQGLDR